MNYDLIIFDCDGTLVKTERALNILFTAAIRTLAPKEFHGFDVNYILKNCIGKTVPEIFDQMEKDAKMILPPKLRRDIISLYQATLPEKLKTYIEPDPFVIDVLGQLSPHFKMCVASNGLLQTVKTSLNAAGIAEVFNENVFAAEQVKKAKPAADLILHAAQKMGVTDLSRILHIEDTEVGALSGKNAQVEVVGFLAHAEHKITRERELRSVGVEEIFSNWNEFAAYALR